MKYECPASPCFCAVLLPVLACLQAYQAAKASRGLYDRADLVHSLYKRVRPGSSPCHFCGCLVISVAVMFIVMHSGCWVCQGMKMSLKCTGIIMLMGPCMGQLGCSQLLH